MQNALFCYFLASAFIKSFSYNIQHNSSTIYQIRRILLGFNLLQGHLSIHLSYKITSIYSWSMTKFPSTRLVESTSALISWQILYCIKHLESGGAVTLFPQ